MYFHGARATEVPTQYAKPQTTLSGVPIVIGTAPVHLATEPKINEAVYVESYEDAVKYLGYSNEFEKYTLCQSIFTHFIKFGVAPVVFINVLDPEQHKTELKATDYDVTGKQVAIEQKDVILDSLIVTNTESKAKLKNGVDYIASYKDDLTTLITLTTDVKKINVSGYVLDATQVTASDVIGGYNEETGEETGTQLIRTVFPKFQVPPGTILAPKFSKDKTVAAVLQSKSQEINGMFKAMALIDIDTASASKYTDVEAEKSNLGITSENAVLLWPQMKYGDSIVSYSAVMAALIQCVDVKNKGIPAKSPSNELLGADAICLYDGTEVNLDEKQANTLNAIGVVTSTNYGGWRSWGNNTACYPSNTDPKDRWINCRRYFNWRENNFIISVHDKVDGIPNSKQIEDIVEAENMKGNSYVNEGCCAGDKIEFNLSENPISNITDGKFVFHFMLAPYTPMEFIEAKFEMDIATIESAYTAAFE